MTCRAMTWGEVTDALIELRSAGPMSPDSGICHNFECFAVDMCGVDIREMDALPVLFISLGLDKHYPVPHPNMKADDAYGQISDLWNQDHEYGRNRWALLDQLIWYAEKQPQGQDLPDPYDL